MWQWVRKLPPQNVLFVLSERKPVDRGEQFPPMPPLKEYPCKLITYY